MAKDIENQKVKAKEIEKIRKLGLSMMNKFKRKSKVNRLSTILPAALVILGTAIL